MFPHQETAHSVLRTLSKDSGKGQPDSHFVGFLKPLAFSLAEEDGFSAESSS